MPWNCIQTFSNHEFSVCRELKKLARTTFCPVKHEWRRIRGKRRREMPVPVAMLTGYVFLLHDAQRSLPSLGEVHGMIGPLKTGGYPALLPDDMVADLMKLSEDEAPKKKTLTTEFRPGQFCKITEGPFAGFEIRLDTLKDETATGLVRIFGRYSRIEIGVGSLKAA
jgi:transcription antitermination factor NusG